MTFPKYTSSKSMNLTPLSEEHKLKKMCHGVSAIILQKIVLYFLNLMLYTCTSSHNLNDTSIPSISKKCSKQFSKNVIEYFAKYFEFNYVFLGVDFPVGKAPAYILAL